MELSTTDYDTAANLSKNLGAAKDLTISLDLPDDQIFSVTLKASKKNFPLTFDKYHALRWKKLCTLKPSEKNELKELLESEMKPILEEARLIAQQTKSIYGEALPTDLGACLRSLADIRDMKILKIKELQEEIDGMDDALNLVELMKENQGILDCLETRANKRQKI